MSNTPRKFFVIGLVVLVVVGMGAPTALAALADDIDVGTVDDTNTAPNPYIKDDGLTKAEHPMDEGASHTALEGYFDDNGDWVEPAESHIQVNTSHDIDDGTNVNPYSFSPGHIQDTSYEAFPDKTDRTWTNASRWSTGGTNSSKLSAASNTTVETGVDGVRFQTGGGDMTSGDTAHWNFSAWDGELDSDESKRVLQVAMDVDSLESATNVTVRVYDETDDYKEITLNQSETAGSGNNFAAGTGDSKVFQIKLNKLTTNGGGTWDNIEKVSIIVDDGDADLSVSWLDLRKKGKNTLGEKRATTNDDGDDPDSDGDYDEFQTIYNATGDVSVHSMETLGSEYDDATITDVTFPAYYPAEKLQTEGDDADYRFSFDEADDFPGWDALLNVSYRMQAPSAIDLTYGTLDLVMTQKWPEERYVSLETATGVSDSTNLTEVSDSSRTSQLSSLQSSGDEITLISGVSSGSDTLFHAELKLTEENVNAIQSVEEEGAAAPPSDDGGIFQSIADFVTNPIGAIVTLAVGILSFRWWRRR